MAKTKLKDNWTRGAAWPRDEICIMAQAVSHNRKPKDAGPIGLWGFVGVPGRRTLELRGYGGVSWNSLPFMDFVTDTLKRVAPGPRIIIVSRIPQIHKIFQQAAKRGGRSPAHKYSKYWATKIDEMFGMLNGPHEGAYRFGFERNLRDGFAKAERQYGDLEWEARPHDGYFCEWPSDWPRITDALPERRAYSKIRKEMADKVNEMIS